MEKSGSQKSSKRVNKLITECLAIEAESAQEAGMLAFMARSMVMATLPHSKPEGFVFQRQNGDYTLTMTGNPKFGLPYGSLPRLLLAWMTREAKRTRSPILQLGETFSSFLRALRLSQSGGVRGDATRLREQMLKLFSTHIACTYINPKQGVITSDQFLITRSFKLWWHPLQADSQFLPSSTITLAQDFFDELVDRPVPIDFRALNALRRSPLQLDLYVWLTYRFSYLQRPTLISWELLRYQFGSDYASDTQGKRNFKNFFIKALQTVRFIYPEANIEVQKKGIILKCSPPHVFFKTIRGDDKC